ncbi:SGNH/GDSL hydrolase family protein [Amycolatopsis jejuensis]|uniref:SGNH/GDSL hydrolase family protein n=1 Tax=Amycolatopsis jejuensis TaxID=330084 RepID=UPI0005265596|nr:SGNH/GDSL hydrolase family protein [Amycolatopsis jejuensis]
MRRILTLGTAAVLTLGAVTASSSAEGDLAAHGWVGTWAASPSAAVPNTSQGYPNFSIRNVVHTSAGGTQARVRLSNTFGTTPLVFGHVTLAVAETPNSPRAAGGTMRSLTFGGQSTVVVPPGAEVLSDPAWVRVPADADLLVTTYVPSPSGPVTFHPLAQQTSFFTRNGDFAGEESGTSFTEQTAVWHYVSQVDVRGPARGTVVTLGDSITDGADSSWGTNHRWPDLLSDRLHGRLGVLNAGISGNRLLLDAPPGQGSGRNALARLADDVLTNGDVRTLIVLEGINDIQQDPHQTDPAPIISALRQIVAQAHAQGIRVLGGTLTPFKGWQVYDATLEQTRQAVNTFIRTSGIYDGVIDFDAALRNPADPLTMLPAYDSGDHLHPNDAGYQRMADMVPLNLL